MADNCSGLCPRCLKAGKFNNLLTVSSGSGQIQNLCSSLHCLFPFCDYISTGRSVFRDSTDQNSDDSQSLDAFLTDILGTVSPGTEHDNLPTTHPVSASSESHVFNTTPAFSHTVFDRYKSLATCSVYTAGSASHDLCSGSSISTNCLLPRYLADNFKRANDHRSNRLRLFRLPPYTKLPERSTVKSGDSGVSLSSLASPSYLDSYEEHLKQRAQLTPSCFPIKPQSDVAGSTGYRKRTSLVPLVDRMITNQKKRLPEC